jgi:hypothetical protein
MTNIVRVREGSPLMPLKREDTQRLQWQIWPRTVASGVLLWRRWMVVFD